MTSSRRLSNAPAPLPVRLMSSAAKWSAWACSAEGRPAIAVSDRTSSPARISPRAWASVCCLRLRGGGVLA
jgi:hypothetical protein